MTKSLYAEFTALPGYEAQVRELLLALTTEVRAEDGNVNFVPFTLESDPRRFFVFEVYADDAAFQEHVTAPHGARFNAALAGLVEGSASSLTWLTSIES